jgi:type I restriction enzyme S subunit
MKFKSYKLSELVKIKYGKNQKNVEVEKSDIPILGTGGGIGYSCKAIYSKPSVLIGRKGSIDKVSYIDIPFWSVDTLFYTEVNEFIVIPHYLYYVMSLLNLSQYDEGTTIPSLRTQTLNELIFDIPPIEDQKRTLHVLECIDNKINLNNKINKNLEEIAKEEFKRSFIKYESYSRNYVHSKCGLDIPADLKLIQISEIPHILESGKRPKGGASLSGIPSVGAENVKALGVFCYQSNKYIPEDFANTLKTGKVNGYELMIYKDGGKPGEFIPHFSMFGEGFPYDNFYINEHVFKLDFYNKGYNEFAYFYFQTPYVMNWLISNGGKAAIPGINKGNIEDIWILSPEDENVKKFCKFVQPLFRTIFINCKENRRLSHLRDTLLPKIMSGEIDVSNLNC